MKRPIKTFILLVSIVVFFFSLYLIYFAIKPTYTIKVYEADTHMLVQEIEDEKLIKELIQTLENAERVSTVLWDMILPQYQLKIMKNEEILYEVGYYLDQFSSSGQYYHYEKEFLYQTKFELPIHHLRNE